MIKKEIRRIGVNFAVSHFLMSFLFLFAASSFYIYHAFNEEQNNIKKIIKNEVYAVENAFVFNELDFAPLPITVQVVIADNKDRIVYGNISKDVDISTVKRDGYLKIDSHILFCSNIKDSVYRVIGAYDLSTVYSLYIGQFFIYVAFSFFISVVFGYFAFLFSLRWLKRIEKSYEDLEEFTEMFSHEVLTPISSALFYINDEEVRVSLLKAKDFLSNFLNFQKHKAFPWKSKKVDIKEVVDLIQKEFLFLTKDKNIQINTNINVENITSNQEFLYFILKNTIENAVKFSKENGSIDIEIYKTDKKDILIKIENSTDEAVLFEDKFESKKGFGLGFHIVKKMVENLNGTLNFSHQKDKITILIKLKDR